GAGVGITAAGGGAAQTGGSSRGSATTGRAGAAGETLFVAGIQLEPPTNYNPFGASPAWPTAAGHSQLIYETLVRFNLLDGTLSPGLAKQLRQSDDLTIELPLQDGTRWSDGSELTAEDVVFTFKLGERTTLSFSTIWSYVDTIEATDARTVTIKLKSSPYNPGYVKNLLSSTLIVPKAIWSKIPPGKITAETNLQPIGSGPFTLDKGEQTQVNLARDDAYWGKNAFGTPAMTTINHPILNKDTQAALKLQSGQIDASQQFIPRIWTMWEDNGAPVGTWLREKPYYLPGNLPVLIFNLSKSGLDNLKLRRAIAYGINYPDIATTAMSDYSEPANASLIVPTGYESKFYDADAVESEGWTYDPDQAVKILEGELKARMGSDGIYQLPDGAKLGGWKLITPAGWTEWNTACEIVAKSAKDIGIGIRTEFPQASTMIRSVQNGSFDICLSSYSGVSPASPWIRFRDALDDRGLAREGSRANWNYGRFENSEVPALLDAAAAAKSDGKAKTAYAALDKIFREDIPCIPLMYQPLEFYEFNQSNWENFPTEANPYAPPMWQGAGVGWLFKLKRVGG
ncbi:MAG: ABC transporter substrate-binding protein, partial [Microlunatus sp.]|nr:ABC transporter substrate-binding protein [Microlunatus sp.]